jgi:hypothetical protein
MRTDRTALWGLISLVCWTAPIPGSGARAQEAPPPAQNAGDRGQEASAAQILKKRGLERQRGTPSNWVLKDEAALLNRFRSVQDQYKRLASAYAAQNQFATGGRNRQVMIAAYQAQIDAGDAQTAQIDQQLAALGPSAGNATADNYHNLLVQNRNTIVGEQRRLGTMINNLSQQGGDFPEQLRQFDKEVKDQEASYRQAVEELRESLGEIIKRYEELGNDEEFAKALSDLSAMIKAKQKVGPTKALKDVMSWLARADGSNRARTATKKGRIMN